MSNTFSLDDIKAAADAKYGNLVIPVNSDRSVTMVNALQLPKEKRAELFNLNETLGSKGEDGESDVPEADQVDVLEGAIRIATFNDPAGADLLIEALDHNLARLLEVFSRYNKGTQAGEA